MYGFALLAVVVFLAIVAVRDRMQKARTIVSNFPIVGRFRYWFESLGGPLRQYIVTGNDEERPFSRDQRRWIYASAKKENNYFGFGTDNDLEQTRDYLIVRHSTFPIASPVKGDADYDPSYAIPCAKVLGGHRGRKKAFRPRSIVNTSAMSYGSLEQRGRRIDQPRRRDRRRDAEHRRGRHLRLPPQGRRPDLADRHRLLRMPRRARALLARAVPRDGRDARRCGRSRSS